MQVSTITELRQTRWFVSSGYYEEWSIEAPLLGPSFSAKTLSGRSAKKLACERVWEAFHSSIVRIPWACAGVGDLTSKHGFLTGEVIEWLQGHKMSKLP